MMILEIPRTVPRTLRARAQSLRVASTPSLKQPAVHPILELRNSWLDFSSPLRLPSWKSALVQPKESKIQYRRSLGLETSIGYCYVNLLSKILVFMPKT